MPSAQRRSSKRERPLRAWLRRTTRTPSAQRRSRRRERPVRALLHRTTRMPSAQRRSSKKERPVGALPHRTTRMRSAQRRSSKRERPVGVWLQPNNANAVGSKTFEQRGTAGKVLTTPGNTVNLGTKPVGNALPTQTPKPNLPLRAPTTAAVKPPPPPHHHHHRPRLRLSRRRHHHHHHRPRLRLSRRRALPARQ